MIVEELLSLVVHVEKVDMVLPIVDTVKVICTVINCEVKMQIVVGFRL